ncbi:hypothetical protein [Neobacillus kokaensis]|uniref:hypothetical protein n=1 Tax=Neobacillus kokaensis TaxID=2759023 RepID=UPI001749BB2C|nr:hypothetical protein [Neobacillus kokaensis]
MDDEWYDGYDGEMYSGSGSKGYKSKKVKLPRFKSIIRKGHRGRRSPRGAASDPETTIVMWVVITLLVSAFFHAEWIFASLYGLFLLYTLRTKDVWLIRYVAVILSALGILFFVALGIPLLLSFMIDGDFLQHPATQTAYRYVIKVPLLSWSIVWMLENWMDWIHKRKYAKANFVEKEKSILQRLIKLCFAASIVTSIMWAIHSIYTVFTWGLWIINTNTLSIIHSWTSTFIIGITFLGMYLQRLANK